MKLSDLKSYKVVGRTPPTTAAGPTSAGTKGDALQRAGGVVNKMFPGEKVGQAIGTLAGYALSPNKDTYDLSAPTPLQVGADVASGVLNVGLFKGVGTTGSFAQRVLKMAGLGAGVSASEAVSEGSSLGDTAKSAAIGGSVGAALPVAGAGLRAVGRQFELLPARFINSALGRSKQQVMQDIAKDNVDDFAKYVTANKPMGSANKLLADSSNNVGVLDKRVDVALEEAVRKTGKQVTIGRNNLLDDIAKLPEAQGALLKRNDVRAVIERLAPQSKQLLQKESLTLTEANRLRQLVDKTLGDRAFLGGQLSSDKAVLKSFADTLREQVKTKAPEGTRELFSELSNEIRFRDGLLDRVAQKQGNQVLSFGDLVGGGLGGVLGGGLPGAIAGVAVRRGVESVPFKISAAKITSALTKAEPVIDQMTPAQQATILNLFAEIFEGQGQSQ